MNRLAKEKSPYLLQHKNNPVDWWPWCEEAFAEAKKSNKPIFLSIGYSTCHWCHVMEVESFEDESVAAVLNKNFIAIKVDREERPDVDDIYMRAVQHLTGRGGWPMSVWLTPERLPFYAGTYFPQKNFIALNERIIEIWQNEFEKVTHNATQLTASIRRDAPQETSQEAAQVAAGLTETQLQSFAKYELGMFDSLYGGFSQEPKFPAAMALMTLMRFTRRHQDKDVENAVKTTLDKMAQGGIYDHLAGGFHRYATDREWLVPHFEKMLYDNALLSLTYLEAYQYFQNEEYAQVARETLDYLIREMQDAEGGIYSAQDADSMNPDLGRKEEGYFCTYSFTELKNALSENELNLLLQQYGATPGGHYEGRNILHLQEGFSRKDKPEAVFEKLRKLRAARPGPHLDDKVLVAWNGLAIAAFAFGYRVLREPKYLKAAQTAAKFLKEKLYVDETLLRRYCAGESAIPAFAEDYAGLTFGLLHLYQADFSPEWLSWSQKLYDEMIVRFLDADGGGLFRDDGNDTTLIARLKEDYDGVTPTASSLAALTGLWLERFLGEAKYRQHADKMFSWSSKQLARWPGAMPMMLAALDFELSDAKEIILETPDHSAVSYAEHSFLQEFMRGFHPHALLQVRENKLERISVCARGVCLPPGKSWAEVSKYLDCATDGVD